VPAKVPSFFTRILIAIPAKASATSRMASNTTVILKVTPFRGMSPFAEPIGRVLLKVH
jgi:hypothetical protein